MSVSAATLQRAVQRLWLRRVALLVFLGLVFVAPLTLSEDRAFVIGWALCSAIVGLSVNVLVGYAGQISLAQAVFFGTGAFTVGNLVSRHGVPWLISLPIAGLVTALVALLIGFPALRIRGLHLAIATLGFQFAMQRVIFRAQFLTGGAAGVDINRPEFGKTSHFFESNAHYLWIILATLVVVWIIDRNLTRSRAGRAFFAIRQDEQVASSYGIPVARYKLLAFALAGFYAGVAGGLFGTLQGDVTNELFDYIFSFEFLVFAVLGGLGSRAGTAVGSAFPVLFRRLWESLATAGQVIGGLALVLTLLRFQGGMAAQGREIAHVARAFSKRGILGLLSFTGSVVASLVAAVAVPKGARFVVEHLVRLLGAEYRVTPAVALMIGVGVAVVAFESLLKLLAARLLHSPPATATDTITLELEEEIVSHVRVDAATSVNFRRPSARASYRGSLLEVDGVSKQFGGVRALDGVSMDVRQGELIGIMGPNGSGKTTLLNCISGFLPPTGGDIRFRGMSVLKMGPHARAALGLGRTFQNVGLVKQETVFDNFLIAQHLVCRYGPMEGLLRTGGVTSEERRLRRRAHSAIELLGLNGIVKERVAALPHGLAKLVELGCALVTGPELLLLDEPAAGVSPQEADALGETLKAIAANFGVTILMIEHHVPLMLKTCDYIYVLNFGHMLTHGEPAEVAAHPDVIAAYLGSVGREASLAAAGGH